MKRQSNSLFILLTAFFFLSLRVSANNFLFYRKPIDGSMASMLAPVHTHDHVRQTWNRKWLLWWLRYLSIPTKHTNVWRAERRWETELKVGYIAKLNDSRRRRLCLVVCGRQNCTQKHILRDISMNCSEISNAWDATMVCAVRMWIDDGFCCIYINLSKRSSLEIHNFCTCVRLLHLQIL